MGFYWLFWHKRLCFLRINRNIFPKWGELLWNFEPKTCWPAKEKRGAWNLSFRLRTRRQNAFSDDGGNVTALEHRISCLFWRGNSLRIYISGECRQHNNAALFRRWWKTPLKRLRQRNSCKASGAAPKPQVYRHHWNHRRNRSRHWNPPPEKKILSRLRAWRNRLLHQVFKKRGDSLQKHGVQQGGTAAFLHALQQLHHVPENLERIVLI